MNSSGTYQDILTFEKSVPLPTSSNASVIGNSGVNMDAESAECDISVAGSPENELCDSLLSKMNGNAAILRERLHAAVSHDRLQQLETPPHCMDLQEDGVEEVNMSDMGMESDFTSLDTNALLNEDYSSDTNDTATVFGNMEEKKDEDEEDDENDEDEDNEESEDYVEDGDDDDEIPMDVAVKIKKAGQKRKRDARAPISKRKASATTAPLVRKKAFERRNIRKLRYTDESKIDAVTNSAQKAEQERLQRLEAVTNANLKALLCSSSSSSDSEEGGEMEKKLAFNVPPKEEPRQVIDILSSEEEGQQQACSSSTTTPLHATHSAAYKHAKRSLLASNNASYEEVDIGGVHCNDRLNVPDSLGRILVNVNKTDSDEEDVFIHESLAPHLKRHQIGGIRFLYDNIVGNLKSFRTEKGFGCILAHCMGLGKTLTTISFCQLLFRHAGAQHLLIIVPVNTLANWRSELERWWVLEDRQALSVQLFLVGDRESSCREKRERVVLDWYAASAGILLIGYEMYRLLTSSRSSVKPLSAAAKCKAAAGQGPTIRIDLEKEEESADRLLQVRRALVNPGPQVVICDEGHRIKNDKASISKSLLNINTQRRVVLTGYPLQNNLFEYQVMVNWVRPNYLGSKSYFANMFERPIANGQCIDSTDADRKLMKDRAYMLHNMLRGFVQRRDHSVLRDDLPRKHEFVLHLRMTQIQRKLYAAVIGCILESGGAIQWAVNNPLRLFSVGCKIWNHPDVLKQLLLDAQRSGKLEEKGLEIADDEDNGGGLYDTTVMPPVVGAGGRAGVNKPRSRAKSRGGALTSSSSNDAQVTTMMTYEWAEALLDKYELGQVDYGYKFVVLRELLQESVRVGDKMLIFSQSLDTLDLIEKFLQDENFLQLSVKWQKNRHYFRLDGSTPIQDRERLINRFNKSDDESLVFLLSTRAGSLGINLIGANRVIVFDASWNPCHDCQAVCRVYRYGQQKTCYIYRLVTNNSLEQKIYERQITKQGMSDRVVDERNPAQRFTRDEVESLLQFDPDLDTDDESKIAASATTALPGTIRAHKPTVDDIFDAPIEDNILKAVLLRRSYVLAKLPFTHESLLVENRERRTREDNIRAQNDFARDKRNADLGLAGLGVIAPGQRNLYKTFHPRDATYNPYLAAMATSNGFTTLNLPLSAPYINSADFGSGRLSGQGADAYNLLRPNILRRTAASTFGSGYAGSTSVTNNRQSLTAAFQQRLAASGITGPGGGVNSNYEIERIQTTTDIVIPVKSTLTTSSGGAAAAPSRIPAGTWICVIKTEKGVYIRLTDGRIFAVRSGGKFGFGLSSSSSSTATTATTTTTSALGNNASASMLRRVAMETPMQALKQRAVSSPIDIQPLPATLPRAKGVGAGDGKVIAATTAKLGTEDALPALANTLPLSPLCVSEDEVVPPQKTPLTSMQTIDVTSPPTPQPQPPPKKDIEPCATSVRTAHEEASSDAATCLIKGKALTTPARKRVRSRKKSPPRKQDAPQVVTQPPIQKKPKKPRPKRPTKKELAAAAAAAAIAAATTAVAPAALPVPGAVSTEAFVPSSMTPSEQPLPTNVAHRFHETAAPAASTSAAAATVVAHDTARLLTQPPIAQCATTAFLHQQHMPMQHQSSLLIQAPQQHHHHLHQQQAQQQQHQHQLLTNNFYPYSHSINYSAPYYPTQQQSYNYHPMASLTQHQQQTSYPDHLNYNPATLSNYHHANAGYYRPSPPDWSNDAPPLASDWSSEGLASSQTMFQSDVQQLHSSAALPMENLEDMVSSDLPSISDFLM